MVGRFLHRPPVVPGPHVFLWPTLPSRSAPFITIIDHQHRSSVIGIDHHHEPSSWLVIAHRMHQRYFIIDLVHHHALPSFSTMIIPLEFLLAMTFRQPLRKSLGRSLGSPLAAISRCRKSRSQLQTWRSTSVEPRGWQPQWRLWRKTSKMPTNAKQSRSIVCGSMLEPLFRQKAEKEKLIYDMGHSDDPPSPHNICFLVYVLF